MFEKATRLKLRFNHKGQCSVEDLWDLSVNDLDTIYKQLNKKAKDQNEESLLNKQTSENNILNLKISIVKYIVENKLAEKEAKENEKNRKDKKQKIMKIMEEKENQELYNKSKEELSKLLEDI